MYIHLSMKKPHLTYELTRATGPEAVTLKLKALKESAIPQEKSAFCEWHDALLYCIAFADSPEVMNAARKRLEEVESNFQGKSEAWKTLIRKCKNSGISGTIMTGRYSLTLVQWLSERFGKQIQYASYACEEDWIKTVSQIGLPPAMRECLDMGDWDFFEWSSKEKNSVLPLIRSVQGWNLNAGGAEALFDSCQIETTIALSGKIPSRTNNIRNVEPYYHDKLLKKFDFDAAVQQPLNGSEKLSESQLEQILLSARAALFCLERETDTVTYTSLESVRVFSCAHGIEVGLFGLKHGFRLPWEAYIGFMAWKNGVPVAYGGSWILGAQAQIGLNIFEAVRGGESAFLFSQIMRVYYGYCGVRKFRIEPYQLGEENPDGIKSGVFWFYYRLGFVPVEPEIRELAAKEFQKIQADKTYRTSIPKLKQCASSFAEKQFDSYKAPYITSISLARFVEQVIQKKYQGNQQEAINQSMQFFLKFMEMTQNDLKKWTPEEIQAIETWSLLFSNASRSLQSLSREEKSQLIQIIRAKGGEHEYGFIQKMQAFSKWSALWKHV